MISSSECSDEFDPLEFYLLTLFLVPIVRIRKNDGETSGISSTETKDFDGDSIETVTGLDSGLSEYMYYDYLHSLRFVTDGTGALKAAYDYYPYGTPIYSMTNSDTDADPTFASHQQDEESGHYYAKQRYYDPETGRFNRLDPVMDGTNWYAYCGGDPVNSIDPDGQFAIALPIIGVVAISTEVILAVAGGMTLGAAITYVVEKYGDEISEYIDDIIDYVEAALKDTDDPEDLDKFRDKIIDFINQKINDYCDDVVWDDPSEKKSPKSKIGHKDPELSPEDAWDKAKQDIEDLIKDIPGVKIDDRGDVIIYELPDGTKIILRQSSSGEVTVEIQKEGVKPTKIRYGKKKNSDSSSEDSNDNQENESDSTSDNQQDDNSVTE